MLGRLAGIDRAARELADGPVHATEIPLRIFESEYPLRVRAWRSPMS
jgi:hypothetical protein